MNYLKVFRHCCFINYPCIAFVLATAFCSTTLAESKDSSSASPDQKTFTFADALKKEKLSINLRYRFEYVTDDITDLTEKTAKASTLRTAFSCQPLPFADLRDS